MPVRDAIRSADIFLHLSITLDILVFARKNVNQSNANLHSLKYLKHVIKQNYYYENKVSSFIYNNECLKFKVLNTIKPLFSKFYTSDDSVKLK